MLLPSKYNPSKERDFPGTVLRHAPSLMISILSVQCSEIPSAVYRPKLHCRCSMHVVCTLQTIVNAHQSTIFM